MPALLGTVTAAPLPHPGASQAEEQRRSDVANLQRLLQLASLSPRSPGLYCSLQAVEQCRSDLADLRTACKAANSHREKCAELLGAATEAVVALEDMLYDPNIDLPRERALVALARRVQTAMDQVG